MTVKALLIASLALLAASVGAVVGAVLPTRSRDAAPLPPAAGAMPPSPEAPPRVELVATPSAATVRAGEEVRVRFSLKNTGTSGTWVLPPLDGSFEGLRYPLCDGAITVESQRVDAPSLRLCGKLNPLDAKNFRYLEPGASLELGGGPWRPSSPGVYTVSWTYDCTPRDAASWVRGRPADPEILRRLSQMPHVRLQAEARIDVLP